MFGKMVDKMKLVFEVIGIEVFIKAYLTLGAIWLVALVVDFNFLEEFNIIHIIIAVILFPFSVAFYNLMAYLLLGNTMFINTIYIWFLIYIIKNLLLFIFAPILGIIFILIVLLTDSVTGWVAKYQTKKAAN